MNHGTTRGWRVVCASLLLAILAVAPTGSGAQSPSPAGYLFDRTLDTLEGNYYGYAKLDADALRARYLPRLSALCAGTERCPYAVAEPVVTEMIASLGDPHTYRVDAQATLERQLEFAGNRSASPAFGLTAAGVPDAAALVVKRVLEDGPAWRAGLRRGDVITAVGGTGLASLGSAGAALELLRSSERRGQVTRLVFDRQGTSRGVSVTPVPLEPWLPELELRSDGVAVITFYQFKSGGKIANRVHDLVRRAQEAGARALVLDVRDSAGGLVSECLGVAGAFLDRVQLLDEFRWGRVRFEYSDGRFIETDPQGRSAEQRVVARPARWSGPLVVVTNGKAKSAPEYLAFLLQRAGRARVVGEPTLGALNTSNGFFSLPDKSSMAVSLGRSLEVSGAPFPERVSPDQPVADDLAALVLGEDRALERASRSLAEVR